MNVTANHICVNVTANNICMNATANNICMNVAANNICMNVTANHISMNIYGASNIYIYVYGHVPLKMCIQVPYPAHGYSIDARGTHYCPAPLGSRKGLGPGPFKGPPRPS